MKRLLASVLLVLLASPAFAADVLVKIKTHSDAIAVGGLRAESHAQHAGLAATIGPAS